MDAVKKLPDAEFQVMKAIWGMAPPVTSASVMEALPPEQAASPKIITLLSRLQKKGFLRSEKPGKEREYFPTVTQEEYLQGETQSLVRKFGGTSAPRLVRCLLDDQKLSREDIEELRQWLDQQDPR